MEGSHGQIRASADTGTHSTASSEPTTQTVHRNEEDRHLLQPREVQALTWLLGLVHRLTGLALAFRVNAAGSAVAFACPACTPQGADVQFCGGPGERGILFPVHYVSLH